jgi:very-short-patch-repair endonuclease
MRPKKDLTGKVFGKLTVLSANVEVGAERGQYYWNCKCECGNEKVIRGSHLVGGDYKSCGCDIKHGNIKKPRTTAKFIEIATLKYGNTYDYSKVNYIGANKPIIIVCKKEGHGEFQQTPARHLGREPNDCAKCHEIEKSAYNTIIDQYLIDHNLPIKRLGSYTVSRAPIEFQCLDCPNIWKVEFHHIKYNGRGCPKCRDRRFTNEEIDNILIERELPIKRAEEYKGVAVKISWECLKCHRNWPARPGSIIQTCRQGSGCPHCARGRNEKLVGKFLETHNISYEHIMIKANDRKYFPDFFIPSLNLIVEYNGIQHYRPIIFGKASATQQDSRVIGQQLAEVNFAKQQIRDSELREYCAVNNINLLEIDGRKYKGDKLKEFLCEYFGEIGDKNE